MTLQEPTRAEKRRLEKAKGKANKTFNMTVESFENSIDAAVQEERKKMCEFVVNYYSASVAMVMHDKWGFGQERLTRVIEQINDLYERILSGHVKIEDIRQAIYEETGLILK